MAHANVVLNTASLVHLCQDDRLSFPLRFCVNRGPRPHKQFASQKKRMIDGEGWGEGGRFEEQHQPYCAHALLRGLHVHK